MWVGILSFLATDIPLSQECHMEPVHEEASCDSNWSKAERPPLLEPQGDIGDTVGCVCLSWRMIALLQTHALSHPITCFPLRGDPCLTVGAHSSSGQGRGMWHQAIFRVSAISECSFELVPVCQVSFKSHPIVGPSLLGCWWACHVGWNQSLAEMCLFYICSWLRS